MNKLHIYVLERGQVLIGRARPHARGDDPSIYTLDDVAVIRRWGTKGEADEARSRGLGLLARGGPTPATILDPEPDGVEVTRRAIYRRIPCVGGWAEGWRPKP